MRRLRSPLLILKLKIKRNNSQPLARKHLQAMLLLRRRKHLLHKAGLREMPQLFKIRLRKKLRPKPQHRKTMLVLRPMT